MAIFSWNFSLWDSDSIWKPCSLVYSQPISFYTDTPQHMTKVFVSLCCMGNNHCGLLTWPIEQGLSRFIWHSKQMLDNMVLQKILLKFQHIIKPTYFTKRPSIHEMKHFANMVEGVICVFPRKLFFQFCHPLFTFDGISKSLTNRACGSSLMFYFALRSDLWLCGVCNKNTILQLCSL